LVGCRAEAWEKRQRLRVRYGRRRSALGCCQAVRCGRGRIVSRGWLRAGVGAMVATWGVRDGCGED